MPQIPLSANTAVKTAGTSFNAKSISIQTNKRNQTTPSEVGIEAEIKHLRDM